MAAMEPTPEELQAMKVGDVVAWIPIAAGDLRVAVLTAFGLDEASPLRLLAAIDEKDVEEVKA